MVATSSMRLHVSCCLWRCGATRLAHPSQVPSPNNIHIHTRLGFWRIKMAELREALAVLDKASDSGKSVRWPRARLMVRGTGGVVGKTSTICALIAH